jgi:ubiquinol-cytochrome c reductase cytochrome b subunit
MVVLITAHVVRVFVTGAYKYPREVNWVLGVGLFGLVLGFSFTGYLLPWDQKAYWATAVGTNMAGAAPLIGDKINEILRGGTELGAATLARFYAFHVLWLPMIIGGLILLHLAIVIRQGIAPRPGALEKDAPPKTTDPAYPAYYKTAYAATKQGGVLFWPDVVAKDALVSVAVVALIVGLASVKGAGLELPADPSNSTYVPRPEWYFLPLFQFLKFFPGSLEQLAAFGVPTALGLAMLALPFFDRRSSRYLLHRPLALVALVTLLGGSGLLLGAAMREGGKPAPVVVVDEADFALTPAQRAGRALYRAQPCASCHAIKGEGGSVGPDLTEVGLRHSAEWMHSFIEEPARFHQESFMPPFGPPKLTHGEIEEIAQYLSSLRGSTPDVEPQFRDTFPEGARAHE